MPLPCVLECEQVSVMRDTGLVLDTLSFCLGAGEALVVSGPNGAGKSTLMRVVAGLKRPDSGTIRWEGADIHHDLGRYCRSVAYLGHQDALKPGLSVTENLAPTCRPQGPGLEAALHRLGAGFLAHTPVRFLSAGQKRRIALARVLSTGARLWLLDEPSLGLDHEAMGQLGSIIAEHRRTGGAVVAATHAPLPIDSPHYLKLGGHG